MTDSIMTTGTAIGAVFGNKTLTTDNKLIKAQIRVIGLTIIPLVRNDKSCHAATGPEI